MEVSKQRGSVRVSDHPKERWSWCGGHDDDDGTARRQNSIDRFYTDIIDDARRVPSVHRDDDGHDDPSIR